MERIDRILSHPHYRAALAELEQLERERTFCRHGMEHLLAVARLMELLKGDAPLSRELCYATALLHDVGRAEQYRTGRPHAQAGLPLAESILSDCGFSQAEREVILPAIASHSHPGGVGPLAQLLYRADKSSRSCFCCPELERCNWPEEEKNRTLEV